MSIKRDYPTCHCYLTPAIRDVFDANILRDLNATHQTLKCRREQEGYIPRKCRQSVVWYSDERTCHTGSCPFQL